MKKKSLALITALLASTLVLTACGSSNSGSSSKSSSSAKTEKVAKSSSTKESSSSKTETAKVDRAGYDAIKLGDLLKQADGGDTLESLKAKFGNPTTSTSGESNGVKTDSVIWNIDGGLSGSSLTVIFTNGRAWTKNITRLSADRPKDITMQVFNSINPGATFDDVNKQLGEPNSMNTTVTNGVTRNTAIYYNKGMTSFASMSFANDVLTTKTQSNLK